MTVRGFVLLGVLAIVSLAKPANADLKTEVPRLVRQLDAPQLTQRESAEAELLRLGPTVLDLLPPATPRTPAEVQQRLGRVRQRLEQVAALSIAKPSTVTLHADAISPADALRALAAQSGNAIVVNRRPPAARPPAPLKVAFENTPFWQALDALADRAGLTIHPYAEQRAISVAVAAGENRVGRAGRAAYSGPFRIAPIVAVARRDFRTTNGSGLTIVLEAAWEPRVEVVCLSYPLANVVARDQRGERLAVANRDARPEVFVGGGVSAAKLDVSLALPGRAVQKIASLKGELSATVAGNVKTFRFAQLSDAPNAPGVQKRMAGAVVAVERVRRSGPAWEIAVRVRFDDAGDALASYRQWIFNNEARLETAAGQRLAYDSYETTSQGKNELGIAYFFRTDLSLDSLTFVYKTATAIVSGSFPYELTDIELP